MAKVAKYCTCGGAMNGRIRPDHKIAEIDRLWATVHSGPDHKPCDAKTARQARARQDREDERTARRRFVRQLRE